MNRGSSHKIIALLALIQGAFGLLRAYGWFQIGVDLFQQGLLIVPIVGAVAILRGILIAVVAWLYFLFFCGALLGARWAWPVCFMVVVINLLLVLNAVGQGAPLIEAIVWTIIPAVLVLYRFSPAGRKTLGRPSAS
ncbi:MAG: hypothetical protein ACREQK_05285 [Candidatus Binatia bacterium]